MELHACPRKHARERRTVIDSPLCGPCVSDVERALRALPDLYYECLHHVSSAARRISNPTRVSGSHKWEQLDVSALDARHHILTVLRSWSEIVIERRPVATPPDSVPHLVNFLTGNLGWLSKQPLAAEFADEIERLHAELLKTIDPAPLVRTPVSDCVMDDCAGKIDIAPQSGRKTGNGSISCSAGHSWETYEWPALRQLMIRKREDAA